MLGLQESLPWAWSHLQLRISQRHGGGGCPKFKSFTVTQNPNSKVWKSPNWRKWEKTPKLMEDTEHQPAVQPHLTAASLLAATDMLQLASRPISEQSTTNSICTNTHSTLSHPASATANTTHKPHWPKTSTCKYAPSPLPLQPSPAQPSPAHSPCTKYVSTLVVFLTA